MIEVFNIIVRSQLTPNQFYLLFSMRDGVSPLHINIHAELRALEWGEWVLSNHSLSAKANILLNEVESHFKTQKKTAKDLLGNDFSNNIKKYLSIFPKGKLPSGKLARSNEKNIEHAFKWFFENHQYTWETIIKATELYVDEYQRKNFLYMRTSLYFIRKHEQDKTVNSELANYCTMVDSGEEPDDPNPFTDKVV